uniref:Serotonin receptor-like protein n=1 Tax=Polyphagotarsonemus latus TaxID=1204166 RepID=A0AAN0LM86_9ACAR
MSFKEFNYLKIFKQSFRTAKQFDKSFFCILNKTFILTFMIINFICITLVSSKTIKIKYFDYPFFKQNLENKLVNGFVDSKEIFIFTNNTISSVPQNLNKTISVIENNILKYSNKKTNVRNVKNLNNNSNEFKQIFSSTNELIENSTKINNSSKTKFLEGSNSSPNHYSLLMKIVICLILIVLILLTIVGNIFVIVAICLDKNLQSAQNYLVLSLAVADLTVAILVMPLCAHMEILQRWTLGSELCTFWNLIDVFSCTASILHLLGIALDRYWSVSSLHYSQRRSLQRMMYLIAAIWLAAAVISMPPLLGVKDPEYANRVKNGQCLMSQDVGYQIFATFSTFYLPCAVILLLYWKIYKLSRKP